MSHVQTNQNLLLSGRGTNTRRENLLLLFTQELDEDGILIGQHGTINVHCHTASVLEVLEDTPPSSPEGPEQLDAVCRLLRDSSQVKANPPWNPQITLHQPPSEYFELQRLQEMQNTLELELLGTPRKKRKELRLQIEVCSTR